MRLARERRHDLSVPVEKRGLFSLREKWCGCRCSNVDQSVGLLTEMLNLVSG